MQNGGGSTPERFGNAVERGRGARGLPCPRALPQRTQPVDRLLEKVHCRLTQTSTNKSATYPAAPVGVQQRCRTGASGCSPGGVQPRLSGNSHLKQAFEDRRFRVIFPVSTGSPLFGERNCLWEQVFSEVACHVLASSGWWHRSCSPLLNANHSAQVRADPVDLRSEPTATIATGGGHALVRGVWACSARKTWVADECPSV